MLIYEFPLISALTVPDTRTNITTSLWLMIICGVNKKQRPTMHHLQIFCLWSQLPHCKHDNKWIDDSICLIWLLSTCHNCNVVNWDFFICSSLVSSFPTLQTEFNLINVDWKAVSFNGATFLKSLMFKKHENQMLS